MEFSPKTLPDSWIREGKDKLDRALENLPLGETIPSPALKAFRYAVATPGKRLRGLLSLACRDLFPELEDEDVLACALAVECLHTASLVLDDLPVMDDAELRRGKATVHRVFGQAQAILAAMALIAESNRVLTALAEQKPDRAPAVVSALSLLNETYSLNGLVAGQSDDLCASEVEDTGRLYDRNHYKTGVLFSACFQLPAILALQSSQRIDAMARLGAVIGLAFQMQDDLLDEVHPCRTGKDQGQDDHKTTFLDLLGRQGVEYEVRERFAEADQILASFGSDADRIRQLLRQIRSRRF